MFFMVISPAWAGTVIYVDDDAVLGGDGRSWQTAYRYLQDGLSVAAALVELEENDQVPDTGGRSSRSVMQDVPAADPCPVEIRVAQGRYVPDCNEAYPGGSGDRDASFELVGGMVVKGGYAGLTGADPNVCDPELYRTVLSGDLAGDDLRVSDPCDFMPLEGEQIGCVPRSWCFQPTQWNLMLESTRRENSRHVVTTTGEEQAVTLSGVMITGGNAYLTFTHWAGVVSYDDEEIGGGILNQARSLTLRDCIVAHNSCFGVGGAMFNVEDCNLVMEDCRLVENYANDSGGAMQCDEGGAILLIRCRFDRNVVDHDGLCTTISSRLCALELRDCTFMGNTDQDQGVPVLRCVRGSVDFDRCVFRDNLGPGVYCSQAEAAFKDCLFQNNTSSTGGALRFNWSDINIRNCTFINNFADMGGAIYASGNSSDVSNAISLKNSLFCGNHANRYGGALYSKAIATSVENCTFSDNRSDLKGGALASTISVELTAVNNIFWKNVAPSGINAYIGQSYLGTHPSSMSAKHCLIEGGQDSVTLDSEESTLTWGEGNFDADPCFVRLGYWDDNGTVADAFDDDFVTGDYHLKSQAGHWNSTSESWVQDDVTSLCIDTGDPNTSVGLESSPNGGRINMGAYGGTLEASKSYFGELPCETIIAGDINGDCKVNFLDLAILASHWLDSHF